MKSEEGVMSMPFRLAISMLIVSIALPICLQSLSEGAGEASHRLALQVAKKISRLAEDVSLKPVGESRLLEIGDDLRFLGPSVSIVAGSPLGDGCYSSIRCIDSAGWEASVSVNLPPEIAGFCSYNHMPMTIDRNSGDIVISHRKDASGELIQLGPA